MKTFWLYDLDRVIEVFKTKVPTARFICEIKGGAHGNVIIKTSSATYIVKQQDFSVWEICPMWNSKTGKIKNQMFEVNHVEKVR